MSVAQTRSDWKTLLRQLRGELRNILGEVNVISDEQEFQDEFIELLERHDEPDAQQAYGAFTRHHQSMVFFIRTIDSLVVLEKPDSLNDLFWTVALAAIQAIFKLEYSFTDLLNIFEELNEALQLDQEDLAKYKGKADIQGCLQSIFKAYIETYLVFIKQAEQGKTDFVPVYDAKDDAIDEINPKLEEWQNLCKLVGDKDPDDAVTPQGDVKWEVIRELGKGTYGVVYLVRELGTNTLHARKSIPRKITGSSEKMIEDRVRNEVEVMRKLRHNHIADINLLVRGETTWDIIMLPVADCNLREFLEEKCIKANYPFEMLRLIDTWFGCLVSALAFAHAKSVKHEDIKPTNVLIRGKLVYLTDFGTAKDFSELEASTAGSFSEQGTPVYWAPEERPWGRAADVWALGCVFAEMLTVRQKRSLRDFTDYRVARSGDNRYAFKSNVPMVKKWLRERIGITSRDAVAITLLEQIFNMLIEQVEQRPDARRIRGQLRQHEERLFCTTC